MAAMLWSTLAVLSAALGVLWLAGTALTPLLAPRDAAPADDATRRLAEAVATPLLAGVLIAYIFLLVFGHFDQTVLMTLNAAVLGLAWLGLIGWRSRGVAWPRGRAVVALLALIVPLVLIAVSAAFTPIEAWDARSIWFFHAKIMTTLHGLIDDPAWRAAENAFSSPMHPKLLPAVGTIVPAALGVWNEFLPKAGLIVLAVPALVSALCFSAGRCAEWFLVFLLAFGFGGYLVNGMADGYFAVYATLSALFATRFLDEDRPGDGVRAVLCFGIAASLKSEAMVLGLALAICFFAAIVLQRLGPRVRLAHGVAAILALAPMVLWAAIKLRWGIAWAAHLNFGSLDAAFAERVLAHLGELPLILDWMILRTELWRYAALAAAVILAGGIYLRHVPAAALFLFGAATLYVLGVALVYTGATVDIVALLDASADRTAMAAALMLAAASFVMLDRAIAGRNRG
jgi:hypothetical protein